MPKACTMPGVIANTALMRGSCTSSAGAASSGSSLRKYSGTIGLLRQPRWKARYFSGLTRAADPERREAALRMAGDADPARVDRLAPDRIVQQEADAEGDVARALPELVREIGDGGVVGVGAVMVKRCHDVAVRGQELGEPGVIEAVAAAPVGEHDERMLIAVGCFGILVKIELGEERQHKRRGGALADRGGIEHPQRQMAAAFVRVDLVELPDPDRKGDAALRALRERCSGRSRQQRAGKHRTARGRKFPYKTRHIVLAHAPVLTSIGRRRQAGASGGPRRERRGCSWRGRADFHEPVSSRAGAWH